MARERRLEVGRREADAVVPDLDKEAAVRLLKPDAYMSCLGVLSRIAQGFLGNPIEEEP